MRQSRWLLLILLLAYPLSLAHAVGNYNPPTGSTGGSGGGPSAIDTSAGDGAALTNTATETTQYSFLLPQDKLGTAQCVEQDLTALATFTGGETLTIKGKYG